MLHVAALTHIGYLVIGLLLGWLGPNPSEFVIRTSASCALDLLLVTLAITPVRRLLAVLAIAIGASFGKRMSDWNWLVRLRRMLGLWCFCYASIHVGTYVWVEWGFDPLGLLEDLRDKTYLRYGLIAWGILLLLSVTSNHASMRAMGRNWKRLHWLSYVAPVVALLHYWLAIKPGNWAPLLESLLLCALLFTKVRKLSKWDGADGEEVAERQPVRPSQTNY